MPVNLITGTDDADNILGTSQRDLIHAGLGDDWIVTLGGNDTSFGEGGNDTIFAYFGGDVLFGGDGDDLLVSSDFDSDLVGWIYGGSGNDVIGASDRFDVSYGGGGDDSISVNFRDGGEAHGGAGSDTLQVNFYDLSAVAPDDRVIALLDGSDAGVRAGQGYLSLAGFEVLNIITQAADDYIRGGALGDRIDAGGGANLVLAQAGDDTVAYRYGGQNFLDGGADNDSLQVVWQPGLTGLVLAVAGTTGSDGNGSRLTGFEHWYLVGGRLADQALLGDDQDFFNGRQGNDTCFGMAGTDRLVGGLGADLLSGGDGTDALLGGSGIDTLSGGQGADGFQFNKVDGAGDLIMDFQSGSDRILISGRTLDHVLPEGPLAGDQFHLGAAQGSGAQFIYRASGTIGVSDLIWDGNGTAAGGEVLIAQLWSAPQLLAADILIL